jgi:hypothetical protein
MGMRIVTLGVCLVAAAAAQTTSTITGRILDSSGALIVGAKVTARHVETSFTRQAATLPDGGYVLREMPVGVYEIRAEQKGFRTLVRRGVLVTLGETAHIDLTLEVGAVEQEVTVTGEAAPVNTASAELSYLVGLREIQNLPLNGRNYTDLALLQPGVVAFPQRDGGSVVAHGLGFSVNGQDYRSNTYLLDGTPMNDFTNGPAGSAAGTVLGLETIREFRVETNSYSAEYGRTSGGQINVLTKSGSNNVHGSLYEYFRNDHLDAAEYFDLQKPKFTRNQYGATVGGPLAKDKSFYFIGFEGLREHKGRTIISAVPDDNARRGILPTTTVTVNAAVQPYLDEIPRANGPVIGGGLARYIFGFNQQTTQDYGAARYDRNITDHQQFFLRYTYDGADQRLPMDFPQFPRDFVSRNQFITAEHRWVISPQTLNTLRAGFSRTRIGQEVEANVSRPLTPFIAGRNMIGDIDIGGMPRFGPQSSVNVKLVQNVFGAEEGLALTRGRHLLKIGALVERYRDNMFNPTFGLGIYTFAGLQQFLTNQAARFIGLPANGALDRYWRFTLFGFYVQDNFKFTPRLSINLGLRYEFSTQPKDIYGRDSALLNLFTDNAPTVGQLYRNPTYKNISPRFGFAWDPFGGGRTSVRGGYGWYFDTNTQQNLIVTVTNPPATPRVSIASPAFPVAPFERGVGNTMRPVQWDIKVPNVHVWNFNIQRQFWGDTVLTAGYAGSRGVHLLRSGDINLRTPVQQPDGTYLFSPTGPRKNTAFTTIELKSSDGNSWYNSGILEIRKRWRGLTAQSSYTWSRNIDTTQASTFFSDATNSTTNAMPELPGFNYNKGLADFNSSHNWVFNAMYSLPSGNHWTLSGWQVSSIINARTGNPVTVFLQNNWSASGWAPSIGPGLGFDRPSLAPGFTHETAVLGRPEQWFDPRAFVLPRQGTLGNLGRNALRGPNYQTIDFSVSKNTRVRRLGEAGMIQFRAEIFNLGNRANFRLSPPSLQAFAGSTAADPVLATFGVVRDTIPSARQVQFALRVAF